MTVDYELASDEPCAGEPVDDSCGAGPRDASDDFAAENVRLRRQIGELERRLRKRDEQRRALLHILGELNDSNKRLADQRKAMLHILGDYEHDRRRLALQKEGLDNSRRAFLHILRDVHQTNIRLANSRKAMIHIMGDLQNTTEEMQHRETELREKQEQLVQAAKLATLGELTTGVAHELNNPLNNIGLFVGNTLDMLSMDGDKEAMRRELRSTMQQVRKATEIISHLRTFGRAAHVTREPLSVNDVIFRALSLVQEQFRLRQIRVELELEAGEGAIVVGNGIRLEQAFINLLTNARDAVVDADTRQVRISSAVTEEHVELVFEDSGCGIPAGCEKRIFDPFFTTKPVGSGTGLGLSITYGIITDHGGTIAVASRPGSGARFVVQLPLARTNGPAAGEE
jgi:C4-dicarboxylate-specific signal transduction histidine kinase